jgi:hypothetical protein
MKSEERRRKKRVRRKWRIGCKFVVCQLGRHDRWTVFGRKSSEFLVSWLSRVFYENCSDPANRGFGGSLGGFVVKQKDGLLVVEQRTGRRR